MALLFFWSGEACLFFLHFGFGYQIVFILFSHFFKYVTEKNVSLREILESNYDYIIFNIYKILEGLVSL